MLHLAGTGALEIMSRLSGVAETSGGEDDVKYFPSPKVLHFLNGIVFYGWVGLSWGERGYLVIAAAHYVCQNTGRRFQRGEDKERGSARERTLRRGET